MKGKKDFINRLMSIMSDSLEPHSTMEFGFPCSRYSVEDYSRYVKQIMSDKEALLFEEHSQDCRACLEGVYQIYMKLIVHKNQQENEALLKKTYDLLTRLDKTVESNLLQLIIKASGQVLELLSTTGERLHVPVLATERGALSTQEKTEPLRIIQEFAKPPVSLQVSAEMGQKEGDLHLKISLYDWEKEEFMSGIEIVMAEAENHKKKMISDENGEALFRIGKPGDYQVTLTAGGYKIVEISLIVYG